MKKWEIIKTFFGRDSKVGIPKLQELKELSSEEAEELAVLAAEEMGVKYEKQ